MKNSEIRDRLGLLVREEKRVKNELIEIMSLALAQESWLEFGYSSLFDWLTRGYGYPPGTAMRRIEAARLLRVVPEAKAKLDTGELSLTAMSKVQNAIQAQEKMGSVALEKKVEALKAVEGLAVDKLERKLVELFPASGEKAKREVHRVTGDGSVRHAMNLSEKATADLKRAKEVLSHKFPNASDAEIIAYALEFLLEKKDPLRLPAASKVEPTSLVKRARPVLQKAQGECAYRDPRTGVKCTSRYQIQLDHIKPRALGGTGTPENLRALCRQHNLFAAERALGKAKMAKYWRSGQEELFKSQTEVNSSVFDKSLTANDTTL
jgi:hypothetical protein